MNYLLGDNEVAARRLKLVASIFAPSTREFLLSLHLPRPDITLDLGCGPGHTTDLLASILKGSITTGLDNSGNFVADAITNYQSRDIAFRRHDISQVPFPIGPADIIYGRYILLHLDKPHELITKWVTQLKAGGLLILEELDEIQTSENLFQQYVSLLESSLAAQNKKMFIGPDIASFPLEGARIKLNRVENIKVSAKNAATMFSMNMTTLQKSPHVRALYSDEEISRFMEDLVHAMDEKSTLRPLDWQLRQVVIERI